jgi:YHS domain-containing protein
MNKLTRVIALGAISAFTVVAGTATADSMRGPSRTSHNLLGEGVGLVGYDPVSYFPEGGSKPEKGLISISAEYDGVTYRFSSEGHKALFQKSPARYAPAYGGWCTWAVAELGKRVDVDPESYVVKGGRLYVFYRDRALDTRAKFLESPDAMLAKAEANWPALAR